jgi:hypothetical protein
MPKLPKKVTEENRINLGEERGAGPNVSGCLFSKISEENARL